jgi:hypothetical protein
VLEPVAATVLVIDDHSAVMTLAKDPDVEVGVPPGILRNSASDMAADLEALGYGVVEEAASASDPETWTSYAFIIWSSGNDTSPVSSAAHRQNLITYADKGGRLLIEGGELAYDAASSPGYPDFADSVLHIGDWNGDDVGPLVLDGGRAGHPIATEPNALPPAMAVSYAGYGDLDAATPSGDAYIIFGTSDYPADAGLLVRDNPDGPGIVFYAFAYSALTDRTEARRLLENTALYLMDDAARVAGYQENEAGRIALSASPNPFISSTAVTFSLPRGDEVAVSIFDTAGRLVKNLVRENLPVGAYRFEWDGRDSAGRKAAPGVYFCSLALSSRAATRKVVLLR